VFIANDSFKIIAMKNFLVFAIIFLLASSNNSVAQTVKVPASLDKWDVIGQAPVIENYLGKESLLIKQGGILLKNTQLADGSMEADMSFTSQRGFPGFAFRVQDSNNMEFFYVRPHQSGNPDATQYTPVFNGYAGWQLYHGEGYTKAYPFKFEQWHHIRIDFHGLKAEIYIDDMQNPLIKVTELKREWKPGRLGVVGAGVPFRIANFQFTPKQESAPTRPPIPASGTGGVITKYQVSNVVNKKIFDKKFELTSDLKDQLEFTTQLSESSGTINLAKFIQPTDTNKTIVARIDLESQADQLVEMTFGFSDYVTIYLNEKAIYSGADNFMSRDYRYLGTIGYFDKLYLPLKKGNNEIWFVVSEDFGGWGVKAKIENMENVTLK
jgi:hypothetical protein